MPRVRERVVEWAVGLGLISPVPEGEAGHGRRMVEFGWDDTDRYRALTTVTLVGLPLIGVVWATGLPVLDLHPLHRFGVVAPTCGLTRGVMWVARGEFERAAQFNPASLVVLPAMAAVILRAGWGLSRGRWLRVATRSNLWSRRVVILVILALAVRQQSVAAFLLAHPAG